MKNVDRQRTLTNAYGRRGDAFYCECCQYVRNAKIVKDCLELASSESNCKWVYDGSSTPCATAYNRYQRMLQKHRRRNGAFSKD